MNDSGCNQTRLLVLSKAGWFAFLLAFFGFAQANELAPSSDDGKSLRQSISGFQICLNAIDADSPDPEAGIVAPEFSPPPAVVWVSGGTVHRQHNPMYLLLRDRLMHAPPFLA